MVLTGRWFNTAYSINGYGVLKVYCGYDVSIIMDMAYPCLQFLELSLISMEFYDQKVFWESSSRVDTQNHRRQFNTRCLDIHFITLHPLRSKIGKRFVFVCFINVFDMERLVDNLCTVWIGKLKLHVNVARYQRDSKKNNYQMVNKGTNVSNGGGIKNGGGLNSSAKSYDNVVKKPTGVKETIDAKEGFGNIELIYMGGFWVMIVFQEEETMKAFHENKSVGSWFSQIVQAHKEFVIEERVIWVEIKGVSCKWWSKNTFNRIASMWESFKMLYRGKTCWVRAIEVPGWVPDFKDDCDDDDFESNDGTQVVEGPEEECGEIKPQSEDPFGVYELHDKKKKVTNNEDKEEGEFVVSQNQNRNDTNVNANESTCSGHFKKSSGPQTGGSIIQLIEDLVNVGKTMSYDMTGCKKNMENIIESQGVADGYR
uniref:Nucleotide-binding alpha-beta plait domain-containing protein n=1 Tax=Tanacetum cinerariifolium TaxID=118510 RepID=A0A699H9A0_TANCI|nr:hypothetical protein [Tanacetum cinerariifolium]